MHSSQFLLSIVPANPVAAQRLGEAGRSCLGSAPRQRRGALAQRIVPWGQLSYDELGEYLREVQADLYARGKEKEEEAERLRLLAATTKWIEAMPSVRYSPLTAALRRQGEIGEHLPRRARMLRARRAAHSCAPPQHRAAKPPIIHYRPVPVC